MLILKDRLINQPVLSLRTGGVVAQTQTAIINPDNLKVEGFFCADSFHGGLKILLNQDVRELIAKGVVVDDYEVLAEPEDLVRLKTVLEIDYQLIGKPVVTKKHRRVGKVTDFALDSETLYVQKIYVGQSILKKLGGTLSVDRNQVIEVTDKKIVIKDPQQPVRATETASQPLPAS